LARMSSGFTGQFGARARKPIAPAMTIIRIQNEIWREFLIFLVSPIDSFTKSL
jgi:hypothetical protein